jgi:hypothetical protein
MHTAYCLITHETLSQVLLPSQRSNANLPIIKVHDQSEYFRNDETDAEISGAPRHTWEVGVALHRRYVLQWALLWKSMVRSSLGSTAYPYALYIQSLDLRNLASLLEEPAFREVAHESFFADDMAKFLKTQDTPIKTRTKKAYHMRLNIPPILEHVGESITGYVRYGTCPCF